MPRISDASERKRALDPSYSFIVQAPAGSGKTELLIQRFLKLLALVEQPEQMLAMTFTRKAAGEMKSRIMEALEQARDQSNQKDEHKAVTHELARLVLEQDSRKGWRLLENPSRLKIQTIDSLCTALTRQMPILSGIGAPLVIEENVSELYRETAFRILKLVESNEVEGHAVRTILGHLDNSKNIFQQRIIQMLFKRDQWVIPFFDKIRLTENSRAYLESVLTGLIESYIKEALDFFPEDMARQLPQYADYCGGNYEPKHPSACLKGITSLPRPEIASLNQWKAIANLLITTNGDLRKTVTKNDGFPAGKTEVEKQMKNGILDLLEALGKYPQLKDALNDVRQLPSPYFTDDEWNVLSATLTLLPELDRALRDVFRERGKTDFSELSISALKALGKPDNPTDLLLYLDTKIQHILVDEYQDTSYKQRELLKCLTAGWTPDDGRTLFIVGDPMQSIYRFRDAEVGLFLHTRNSGVGDIQLEPLTLKSNFRSQKDIIEWVNSCFSAIFPKRDDPDLGSIQYSPSVAVLPKGDCPGVILHPVADPDGIDESSQIVKLIQNIRSGQHDASIVILVRARSHLQEIVRLFNEQKIHFKAEEIDPLTSRPEIQDLLALLRALLSPLDRVSWLSILRAPWCGLSLSDLHALCVNDKESPVWNLLNNADRTNLMSADGQIRLKRFTDVMGKVQKARHNVNFRDLLEGCWIALGGPACLSESALSDIDLFFANVSSVIKENEQDSLYRFDRILDNLYAGSAIGSDNAVQIMTMHKAKGLEFDYVILPGLGKKPKSEQKRLVYWMPHGDDLLLAPVQETGGKSSEIYSFLSRLDKEKEQFEILRLLYVSVTRAKKQLHLFGFAQENDLELQPAPNSLLSKLWPFISSDWQKSKIIKMPSTQTTEPRINSINYIRRLPASFELPSDKPSIETGISVELGESEKPAYEWAGSEARCLGNILHRCFKDMADYGLAHWTVDRINNLSPILESALNGEGLFQTQRLINKALKALNNILLDPIGQWILTNQQDHRSEYPLTGVVENHYIERTLDRTFIDEHDIRWIIDFKTGEHEGTDLDEFFRAEVDRYRAQMDQYEYLIRMNGEQRPIKKALYYPLHRRLIEVV